MKNDILPIGTVVRVDNNLMMIIGYMDKNKSMKVNDNTNTDDYDYVGCRYPFGVEEKGPLLINKKGIKDVVFIGYQDNSFSTMKEKLKDYGW